MDHTEKFIRLNCSLLPDYKMMKLETDMFWKKFHFQAATPVRIQTGKANKQHTKHKKHN